MSTTAHFQEEIIVQDKHDNLLSDAGPLIGVGYVALFYLVCFAAWLIIM